MSLLSGSLTLRSAPKVTPEEFTALREFIYGLTGIDIPAQRQYLIENRLGPRLGELHIPSFGEYLKYLKFSREKDAELKQLFELITTNETSLFRDTKQLEVVRDKLSRRSSKAWRSPGRRSCASGPRAAPRARSPTPWRSCCTSFCA